MGESAVLVHSYTYAAPITTLNESHQEKTNHALSQSISFGQFAKENLEWGKWSSFSHQNYVEEAKKYSRPGSVAQKTAFFEAHYKKIAESKKHEQFTVTPSETLLPPPLPPLLLSNQLQDVKEDDDDDVLEDDLMIGHEEMEKKQEEEEEEEKEKTRTKNKPVFRLSLEKTIPPKPIDIVTQSLKNEDKPVHRQKFSFFNCFMGNAKTQDKNKSRRKNKKKQFVCLCFK